MRYFCVDPFELKLKQQGRSVGPSVRQTKNHNFGYNFTISCYFFIKLLNQTDAVFLCRPFQKKAIYSRAGSIQKKPDNVRIAIRTKQYTIHTKANIWGH